MLLSVSFFVWISNAVKVTWYIDRYQREVITRKTHLVPCKNGKFKSDRDELIAWTFDTTLTGVMQETTKVGIGIVLICMPHYGWIQVIYIHNKSIMLLKPSVVDAGSLSTIWVLVMIWPMRCVDILTLWWLYLIDWKLRYVGHLVALDVRQAGRGISGHGQLSGQFAGAMLWKWTTIDTG